jgi:hypothetical protein
MNKSRTGFSETECQLLSPEPHRVSEKNEQEKKDRQMLSQVNL